MSKASFSRRTVEEALTADGVFHLRASGVSMQPTIPPGSLLLICSLQGTPRVGEVVLVHPHDSLWLCHRVLKLLPGGRIITKGDGNPGADAPVEQHDILGVVTGMYLPGGRYVDLQTISRRMMAGLIVPVESHFPGTLRTVMHCVRHARGVARPWYNRVRKWLP